MPAVLDLGLLTGNERFLPPDVGIPYHYLSFFGHIFGGKNAMELEVSRHTLPLSALSGKNACCLGPWLANRK